MKEFINYKKEKPAKICGKIYQFKVELESDKFKNVFDYFHVVWDGKQWCILNFASVPEYNWECGDEFFKVNKPRYWREL